jgi:hypothetical protein
MIAVIRGPYSHWRRHTLRRHTAGPDPARASARDQLMLNHLHRHRRQVDHLPPLHTHLHGARQIRTTPRAQTRLMPPPLVRVIDQRQRRPRMTGLPTRLATAPAPQRLRSRLGKRRVRRRRLRRVPTVLPQLPPQLGDLGPQQLDLLSLPSHQRRKFLIRRASIRRHHAMIDKTNEKIN